jgi:hypothetical protein
VFGNGWPVLLALVVFGCEKKVDRPFPSHVAMVTQPKPDRGFDLYVEAAKATEEDIAKQVTRTMWTPGQKDYAIQYSSRPLGILRQAQSGSVTFAFKAQPPGTLRESVRGWRFLGRVLEWKVEDAIAAEDYSKATDAFLMAARMAPDLAGGDAADAGLGFEIAMQAAKPYWQALDKMPSADLSRASSRLQSILAAMPDAEITLRHERETMAMAIQWVQDKYTAGDFDAIRKSLGSYVEPTIKFMRRLKSEGTSKQVEFFEGLDHDADDELGAMLKQASRPFKERDRSKDSDGPWRRLSNSYFRGGEAYLSQKAQFESQIRLLAIDAMILPEVRKSGNAPATLPSMPKWLRTDPYSGGDFVYEAEGPNYKLYGVGPDGRDDGGGAEDIGILR